MEASKQDEPRFARPLKVLMPFLEVGTIGSPRELRTNDYQENEQHIVMGQGTASHSIGKVNLDKSFNDSGNGGQTQEDMEPTPAKYQSIIDKQESGGSDNGPIVEIDNKTEISVIENEFTPQGVTT